MIWRDEDLWDEYVNGLWDWVVTKAEILEFSFVSTPSNRASVLNEQETVLANEISKNLNIDLTQVETLFSKNVRMSKDVKTDALEEKKNDAAPEVVENETPKDENDVETLQNKVSTLEETIVANDAKIEKLEAEAVTNAATIEKLENQAKEDAEKIEKLENDGKDKILAKVKNESDDEESGEDAPKDVNSFKEKYSK